MHTTERGVTQRHQTRAADENRPSHEDHSAHARRSPHAAHAPGGGSPPDVTAHARPAGGGTDTLNRVALSATVHCLTGCAIGEVTGMVVGTSRGWSVGATVALSVVLAFVSGYALTILPLLRAGLSARAAAKLALAADTVSIAIMEIVDNAIMVAIPGAMAAGLREPRFWGSLAGALLIAGAVAYPINRWLIARGRGHAILHRHHG